MSRWDRFSDSLGDRYGLYRDPDRGMIAGVCAGIADYLGVRTFLVRLAAVFALCFFVFPVLIAYVVLAFFLPRQPRDFGPRRESYRDQWRASRREERRAARKAYRAERRAERHAERDAYRAGGQYRSNGSASAHETLQALLDKFSGLENRLAHIEGEVTSSDFELKRKFRDIGG
jgi:phage shock protein C